MKGGLVAAAAALATGANAFSNHRHAHQLFAKRGGEEVCTPGCTTIWTTITGEPTLCPPAPPTHTPEPEPTVVEPTTTEVIIVVPTEIVHVCPTEGTYTFPAETIIVTETTNVCVDETATLPPGTHTVGGVTTVVETQTTVTCPVATTGTDENGVVTKTVIMTEVVCPSAGTYTIAPITTTVVEETVIVYPVPTEYCPGTYTAPETVVTVTETDYVVTCPFTNIDQPKPTQVKVEQAPPPPPPQEQAPPKQQPPKQEKPKNKKPKTQGDLSNGKLGSEDGDHYGLTYTPYDSENGACKSASQVDADIKELKDDNFNIVRVYSTDCSTLENVGSACRKHGVDMIVGIFVKGGCSYDAPDIKEQVDAIAAWGQWDMVKLFVVGNEAIMNGLCSASELRQLITTVKSKCSAYNGPYTIAETLNIWQQDDVAANICSVVDVTGANIHPYFNSDVAPSEAGQFVKGQLDLLENICPGNEAINLECGWPSGGRANGRAQTGKSQQWEAIHSIRELVGSKTVFFSYEDDKWKEPGVFGAENFFGSKQCFKDN